MEQLLAFAGLVEEWGPLFAACGVATVSDLVYVQPSSLGMLGLTLSEAHQLLDVAWSVYAVGGVEAYAEVQMAASAAEGAALGILASVIAALDGGSGARLPGTRSQSSRGGTGTA